MLRIFSSGYFRKAVYERFVLTAAHCLARRNALSLDPDATTYFVLAGGSFQTRAIRGWSGDWMDEASPRDGDWAVMELDRAVPSYVARPLPLLEGKVESNLAVLLPGFSMDQARGQRLSVDRVCRIRLVVSPTVFHHDCGAYAGASGGPILTLTTAGYAVVGVHNAHKSRGTDGLKLTVYSRELANLGASVRAFGPAIRKLGLFSRTAQGG